MNIPKMTDADLLDLAHKSNGFWDNYGQLVEAARDAQWQAAMAGQEPVGYINHGIEYHTRGKTIFHEKPTKNLERRWWAEDIAVYTHPAPTNPAAQERAEPVASAVGEALPLPDGIKPVVWMDMDGGVHHCPRQPLFGLIDDTCGSQDVLWTGFTFNEALQAWKDITSGHSKPQTVRLTGRGAGVIASPQLMAWKFGKSGGTFACPICGKETPHEHSGEMVALYRDNSRWEQDYMEKKWKAVEEQAAALEARHPWYTPLYATPPAPAQSDEDCPKCKGSEVRGYQRGLRCPVCNGTGNAAHPAQPSPEPSKPEQVEAPCCINWEAGTSCFADPRQDCPRLASLEKALPMESAPKDGTLLRLLVDFEDHATEDSAEPCWTIGGNSLDNTGVDLWQFVGWNWTHDCFTDGVGKPVGWLPMLATLPPASAAGEGGAGDREALRLALEALQTIRGEPGSITADLDKTDAAEEAIRAALATKPQAEQEAAAKKGGV